MAHSISKVLLHLVFSTKGRRDTIREAVRDELHAHLAATCRRHGSEAFRVGGTGDHVHIACSLPRTMTVSKLVERLKTSSSSWLNKREQRCGQFSWQAGCGAFSLGQSQLPSLIRYIDRQAEHHERSSADEELRVLLERYEIAFEE